MEAGGQEIQSVGKLSNTSKNEALRLALFQNIHGLSGLAVRRGIPRNASSKCS